MMKQLYLRVLIASFALINYAVAQPCEGWAVGGGGLNNQEFASVATDAAGNIYAAGEFDSIAHFESYTHDAAPYLVGIYLNKYDQSGQLLWSKMVAQGDNIFLLNGITSSANALFLCGGGNNIKVANDSNVNNLVYVIKTDFDGNILDDQLFTNSGGLTSVYPYATYITMGPDSNLFFTGRISGNVSFGSVNLYSDYNTTFLVKLDQNLNTIWAIEATSQTSTSAFNRGNHISFLSDGRIILSGAYFEKFAFGSNSFGNTNGSNTGYKPYVALFNTNGTNVWLRGALGSGVFTTGYTNGRDSQNNIYLAGSIEDTLTFGSITVTPGNSQIFIAKYNTAGTIQWLHSYGKNDVFPPQWAGALLVDPNDTLYLIGQIDDSSSMGSFLIYDGQFGAKIFIAKMNTSGNVLDVRYSKKGIANTYDADFDTDQSPIVGGAFSEYDIIFGDTYMANSSYDTLTGTVDIFVWKVCWNDTACCDTVITNNDDHTNLFSESHLFVYPNPANNFLMVNLPSQKETVLQITNLLGQIVFAEKVNSAREKIDISALADGMYQVVAITASRKYYSKFLKQ